MYSMKVNCIYHNTQLITNFCQDKHCLMPLCPQCISQHTQYHEDQRSRPKYSTIQQIMAEVHTEIGALVQSLNQDKDRNGALIVKIQTVADKVKEKIVIARDMVIRAVQESFIMLEKQVNRQLEKQHQRKSVYSLIKSQKQDKIMLQHLDQLQAMRNTLKGQRGLSHIIYFMREKQAQVENFHSQFSTYLHVNENYQPKIQINTQALYSLDAVISRMIKVSGAELSSNRRKDHNHHHESTSVSLTPNKQQPHIQSTTQKLRQRHNIPIVESEVRNYSPKVSKILINNNTNVNTNTNNNNYRERQKSIRKYDKIDNQYEKLSRKVVLMREQNQRLSRVLRKNQNTFNQ